MVFILGINSAYHESSCCILKNGKIIAIGEEERFNRIKHAKRPLPSNPDELPLQSISYCLKEAGISWHQIDHVGYSFVPILRLQNIDIDDKTATKGWWWKTVEGEILFYRKILTIPQELSSIADSDIKKKFKWIEHHVCHASSAYFCSPFNSAAILSVDGIGEFATTWIGHGKYNQIQKLKEIEYPDSIGFLWETFCKFLGFSLYDASKLMGLAAYGDSKQYIRQFKKLIKISKRGFRVPDSIFELQKEGMKRLENLFEKPRLPDENIQRRHADIAAGLQEITNEIMINLAREAYDLTKEQNLCISGGVALNCISNYFIQKESGFKRVYVQPASHDAGTAIGAALYIWNHLLGNKKEYAMPHPYFGPQYSNSEIKQAIEACGLNKSNGFTVRYVKHIEKEAARMIADGNVVSWFQGRMEVGPRALGNRSLLADPRDPTIKDFINKKIKHREDFRPLAPSILDNAAKNWFKFPKRSLWASSQFMVIAYPCQHNKITRIPAVLHRDNTSRIQTVDKKYNSRYYKLIQQFEKITSVPILLNTSFNDQEPIVCAPKEAIDTFVKTEIDALAMGNYLIKKKNSHTGFLSENNRQRSRRILI